MNRLDQILPSDGIRAAVAAKRLGLTPDQVVDMIKEKTLKGLKVVDGKRKIYVTTEEWIVAHLNRCNPELRKY